MQFESLIVRHVLCFGIGIFISNLILSSRFLEVRVGK